MSKRLALLAPAVAVAGVALAVGAAALPAAAAPHGRTLHYTATFTSNTSIDLGRKGESSGDRSTDVATLKAHGRTVGTLVQDCALIRPGRHSLALCEGAFRIGGSTIFVSTAPRADAATLQGAVVGGTGRFAGAAGTFDAVPGPTSTVTIHLAR